MLSTGARVAGSRWAVSTTTFGWLYLTCALAMRIASTPSANLSYLMIAAYALLGRAHAIRALAISWLFSMLNPGLVAEATAGSIGRYAVVAGAAVAVLWRSSRSSDGMRVRPVILTTLLLGVSIVLHAFFFSSMIDVSILKISSWTVVMATVLSAWLGLSPKDRATVCQQIFGGLVLLLLVSLPFLASGLGYLRNGFGFQGVMNHPQAFGPTMALLGAWAASSMLAQRRPAWTLVGLVSLSIVLVFLSEARTAGISVLVGTSVAAFCSWRSSGRAPGAALPGLRSKRVQLVGIVVLSGTIMAGAAFTERIAAYIFKRSEAATVGEVYERSRGRLILGMVGNIAQRPVQGIGFGIGSDFTSMEVQRDPVFGLPVSASIEKGVLPLAVLEELGIIGFAAVAAWIWMLLRRIAGAGTTPLAVSLTALLLNLGESTFFSPGGLGLLSLILLGWAFACGDSAGKGQ